MAQTRLQMRNASFVASGMAGVIETADADQMIVDAAAELYELLVVSFERWFTVSTTNGTTIASGADSFALPADFLRLDGLDFKDTTGDWIEVLPFVFGERNERVMSGSRRYDIVGSTLVVRPSDQAPGLYRLWYTPRFPGLASDGASFDGINGWEEYVVTDAAIRQRDAEESDTAQLQDRKAALMRRIERAAKQRNTARPRKPRDVRGSALRRLLRDRWSDTP